MKMDNTASFTRITEMLEKAVVKCVNCQKEFSAIEVIPALNRDNLNPIYRIAKANHCISCGSRVAGDISAAKTTAAKTTAAKATAAKATAAKTAAAKATAAKATAAKATAAKTTAAKTTAAKTTAAKTTAATPRPKPS